MITKGDIAGPRPATGSTNTIAQSGAPTDFTGTPSAGVWKDLDHIVLVGLSYGGLVITGAAEKIGKRLASIVYVDAFIPADGQSFADITGWNPDGEMAAPPDMPEDALTRQIKHGSPARLRLNPRRHSKNDCASRAPISACPIRFMSMQQAGLVPLTRW